MVGGRVSYQPFFGIIIIQLIDKNERNGAMNSEGIYNDSDFKKGAVAVKRSNYEFPSEVGEFEIEAVTICRYWGKRDNLILLVDEIDTNRKLKFSFWKNKKYCCEPVPARQLHSEKESVRKLTDGSRVKIKYSRSANAGITRVREIDKL